MLSREVSNAQSNSVVISRIEDIKTVLLKNYKIEQGFLDTACLNTVIMFKFKIVDKKLDSIEFTKSIPLPIKKAILNAVQSHKIEFQLNNTKYENKTVLIPLHFVYYTGCQVPSTAITIDTAGKIQFSGNMGNKESLDTALLYLLNLESGSKVLMDCVLLSPMSFTTLY